MGRAYTRLPVVSIALRSDQAAALAAVIGTPEALRAMGVVAGSGTGSALRQAIGAIQRAGREAQCEMARMEST